MLEVVLSIDNLVVIAVLVGKLPKARQANARYVGMTLALVPRLVLLVFIGWIIGLTEPMFYVFGHGVSGKDLILAIGGLFTAGALQAAVRSSASPAKSGDGAAGPSVRAASNRVWDVSTRRSAASQLFSSCAATRRLWGSQAA